MELRRLRLAKLERNYTCNRLRRNNLSQVCKHIAARIIPDISDASTQKTLSISSNESSIGAMHLASQNKLGVCPKPGIRDLKFM